jgi:hypothetical protein
MKIRHVILATLTISAVMFYDQHDMYATIRWIRSDWHWFLLPIGIMLTLTYLGVAAQAIQGWRSYDGS